MSDQEDAAQLVEALLNYSHVKIGNVERTTKKLARMIKDTDANVHFISDFDNTMSKHWVQSDEPGVMVRNSSSHGIPARYSKISPRLKAKTKETYEKYYPIEIDRNLTHDEKVPYMITWWQEAHRSLIEERLTRQDIENMANEITLEMRQSLDALLTVCNERSIPFLVFSAGIGNIIEEQLKQANLLHDNMHTVSNMMLFDENDVCVGFKDPLIHVFNKSEFQLEVTDYFQSIKHRTNVILAGDSLGDLQMSQGIKHDLCLNIGFLNHDVKELESRYIDAFDIVIENDEGWGPVIRILDSVKRQPCQ